MKKKINFIVVIFISIILLMGLTIKEGSSSYNSTITSLGNHSYYTDPDSLIYRKYRYVYEALFPVGSGFIDFTNKDYSKYLGFTWERELVGLSSVGLDTSQEEFNTIGKTGGSKTATVSTAQLPSHTHIQNPHYHVGMYWAENGYGWALSVKDGYASGYYEKNDKKGSVNTNYMEWGWATATNQNTGGNQAHNNLSPYKVVAYWKRVA